jgi:hypothetical protein
VTRAAAYLLLATANAHGSFTAAVFVNLACSVLRAAQNQHTKRSDELHLCFRIQINKLQLYCCGGLGLGESRERETGKREKRRRGSDAVLGVAHEQGSGRD